MNKHTDFIEIKIKKYLISPNKHMYGISCEILIYIEK